MSRVLAKSSYFLLEFSTKTRLGVLGAVAPFVKRPAEAHHQQDLCPRLPRHGEPRHRWPSKKNPSDGKQELFQNCHPNDS